MITAVCLVVIVLAIWFVISRDHDSPIRRAHRAITYRNVFGFEYTDDGDLYFGNRRVAVMRRCLPNDQEYIICSFKNRHGQHVGGVKLCFTSHVLQEAWNDGRWGWVRYAGIDDLDRQLARDILLIVRERFGRKSPVNQNPTASSRA